MKNTMRAIALLCSGLLLLPLAGCAKGPDASDAPPAVTHTSVSRGRYRSVASSGSREKYTQADYDLAASFQTEGYGETAVETFNRSVLNWDDEESYHKTEEALQRLLNFLPEDDALAPFFFGTLMNTWRECEKRHYNACEKNQSPWHGGYAQYEIYGDVFGDQMLLKGAYADFDFNYTIADPTALTVSQRDAQLESVGKGLEEFLKKQSETQLQQRDKMEKSLKSELERLVKALGSGLAWGGDADVSYYWDQPWSYSGWGGGDVVIQSGTGDTATATIAQEKPAREEYSSYTKAQYELALNALQFEGYKDLSIAEFNRRVHAALDPQQILDESASEELEKLQLAYEMVSAFLPQSDANYDFFHTTVPASLNEYGAKAQQVATGQQADPAWRGRAGANIEANVYGDTVVTGGGEGDYSFSYRILNADSLTVAGRDAFLKAVTDSVGQFLQQAMKEGKTLDEAAFQAGVEAAGKAAGTADIEFVACTVDFFEMYW